LDSFFIQFGWQNFVNPPFSIAHAFIIKFLIEWSKGKTVFFIVPTSKLYNRHIYNLLKDIAIVIEYNKTYAFYPWPMPLRMSLSIIGLV